jgi:hypothetical protein
MNNKKNFLRDVLPKSSVRSFIKEPRELEVEEEAEQKNWGVSYEKPKIQRVEYDRKSRKGLWFLALIAVLVLVFAISYVLFGFCEGKGRKSGKVEAFPDGIVHFLQNFQMLEQVLKTLF